MVSHRQDSCIKLPPTPAPCQASGEDFTRGQGTNAGKHCVLYVSPQQPRLPMYTAAVTYTRPEQDDVDEKFQKGTLEDLNKIHAESNRMLKRLFSQSQWDLSEGCTHDQDLEQDKNKKKVHFHLLFPLPCAPSALFSDCSSSQLCPGRGSSHSWGV